MVECEPEEAKADAVECEEEVIASEPPAEAASAWPVAGDRLDLLEPSDHV